MRNILICYFSGTGNTKMVVDACVKSFEENEASVTLHNIDDGDFTGNYADYDAVGFAYPIHAFNAPANVLKFAKNIKKLQKNNKKPLFIVKTSGEPLALNNISSLKLKSILRRRGFNLSNEYHYCMPYNIIFRHTDNMAYKMWNTAQNIIPLDCKDILLGKPAKLKFVPFGRFLAWVFRIEHWGGRFNGKRYSVGDACLKCGLCVKNCPTHNIKIEDGKFCFGKNCLMCMRCSFNCPANAIKIGLFEKWKVNGKYNFDNFNEAEEQTHQKYCKKAYKKYFEKNQGRLDEEIKKS